MNKVLQQLKDKFGDKLPDYGTFVNTQTIITRYELRNLYKGKGATDFRRYLWLKADFAKFLANQPKPEVAPVVTPKVAPKPDVKPAEAAK